MHGKAKSLAQGHTSGKAAIQTLLLQNTAASQRALYGTPLEGGKWNPQDWTKAPDDLNLG